MKIHQAMIWQTPIITTTIDRGKLWYHLYIARKINWCMTKILQAVSPLYLYKMIVCQILKFIFDIPQMIQEIFGKLLINKCFCICIIITIHLWLMNIIFSQGSQNIEPPNFFFFIDKIILSSNFKLSYYFK